MRFYKSVKITPYLLHVLCDTNDLHFRGVRTFTLLSSGVEICPCSSSSIFHRSLVDRCIANKLGTHITVEHIVKWRQHIDSGLAYLLTRVLQNVKSKNLLGRSPRAVEAGLSSDTHAEANVDHLWSVIGCLCLTLYFITVVIPEQAIEGYSVVEYRWKSYKKTINLWMCWSR